MIFYDFDAVAWLHVLKILYLHLLVTISAVVFLLGLYMRI